MNGWLLRLVVGAIIAVVVGAGGLLFDMRAVQSDVAATLAAHEKQLTRIESDLDRLVDYLLPDRVSR